MADSDRGTIRGTSDGGVAGEHTPVAPIELRVGSSTSDQVNTVRLRLIPVACFRVDDIRFAFDSSFLFSDPVDDKNDIRAELRLLADLLKKEPELPLSVFGHADPVGNDDYNKQLSGRRATVVYALLISPTESSTAISMWQGVARQENWGARERTAMQALTGLPAGTAESELFRAYMQKLMPPELKLGKKNFLAQGVDPKGKGDFQGCSEFNPLLIFSTKRNSEFESQASKTPRNDANAENRRVMVLLFRKGSKVDPARWPCPRATEGVAGCRARFWSDGETRRTTRLPDKDRRFEESKDTFACRFYQRLITTSPCEGSLFQLRIRLFDRQARALPGAPCVVTVPGQDPKPDRASGVAGPPAPLVPPPSTRSPENAAKGDERDDAFVTVRGQGLPATVNVKWSRPRDGEGPQSPRPNLTDTFEFEMDVAVDVPDDDADSTALTLLKNLGYEREPKAPEDNIRAFQIEYKTRFADIVADGKLNAATKKAIKEVNAACDPVLKGPRNTPV